MCKRFSTVKSGDCSATRSSTTPATFCTSLSTCWCCGTDVEDLYGPREFLIFYLVAAVVGGLCFILGSFLGVPGARALGASGAVTAVLVLCALHYPTRMVWMFWLLPIPIWLVVLF